MIQGCKTGCVHDARPVFAGDLPGGVVRSVVHNQNLGAGKNGFERPPQAQGIIRGV
jgi:hypothetical protein